MYYNKIGVSLHHVPIFTFIALLIVSIIFSVKIYNFHSRLHTYGRVDCIKMGFILRRVHRFQPRQTKTCLTVCPYRKHCQNLAKTCESTNKKIPHDKCPIFRRLLYAFECALKRIIRTRHGHMTFACLVTQTSFPVQTISALHIVN